MAKIDRNVFGLLADVLEYPTSRLSERAQACRDALSATNRPASRHLDGFAEFCGKTLPGSMEELYTDTFELEAICSPYVGFHLFGEDRTRGTFMVGLKEHYARQGLHVQGELPDHITVMLRSLSTRERDAETRDLVSCCLIPALKKMISLFRDDGNPYQGVLEVALVVLEEDLRA